MNGTLFIISAPSGAGKTTLLQALLLDFRDDYSIDRVITYTTKAPRQGERDGEDYHFVSRERFEELLQAGFFIEHSKAYSDYYGSPSSLRKGLSAGISYLLIVDRVGAQKIKKVLPNTILFWIEAPSIEELKKRIVRRGADSDEVIDRRMARAEVEMALECKEPIYTHHIINNNLSESLMEMKCLILPNLSPKRGKEASRRRFYDKPSI